jgi:hypothetical protein
VTKRKLFKRWLTFEIALPLLGFGLLFLAALLVHAVPHPFIKTFAGLDLLPVMATILLGLYGEVEFESAQHKLDSSVLENVSMWSLILGVALLLAYGFLKPWIMTNESSSVVSVEETLQGFAYFAVSAAFFVVGFAYWGKRELFSKFPND